MIITAMQDLEQGATEQLRVIMGLREPAGSYPRTKFRLTRMRNWGDMKITYGLVLAIRIGPARCQQTKEM